MKTIAKVFFLSLLVTLGSGCATKVLNIDIPESVNQTEIQEYVKIVDIQDLRKFEKSPETPSTPSIENDLIDDKAITDKAVGRARHGMFHNALWNYSLEGDEDIYSVCKKIATNSLNNSGYQVLEPSDAKYSEAIPVSIEILQFWGWMQPHFNIDLLFEGELRIRSSDDKKSIDVTGTGSELFSTAMAGASAWTKLISQGAAYLEEDLTIKLVENLDGNE